MNLPTKISEFIQQQIEERQKSGLIELQNAKLAIENDGLRLKEDVRTLMTEQLLPLEPDGCIAVPTAPGLGVDLDLDVFESLRVEAAA